MQVGRTMKMKVNVVLMALSVISQIVFGKSASVPENTNRASSDVQWKSTSQMIAAEKYPVESIYITTADGYILNIHRIPGGKSGKKNGKVAYLQHGSFSSSSDWVQYGPVNSLGYILADEGYDVWMGNTRGNTYSRNHTSFNPDSDAKFWDFTWHEMGVIDIPTIIDHILEKTNADGIYYVGHSQGATVFYVMASVKPEYNKKIKTHVSLAPIGFVGHLRSPVLRIMATVEKPVSYLLKQAGLYEMFPTGGSLVAIANVICRTVVGTFFCNNIMNMIVGYSPQQMNITRVPLDHFPAGASTKALMHFVQEISSKKFCQYDYGNSGNMKKYGQSSPPRYDLKKITAPVYIIYSQNDWLNAMEDVEELYKELPNPRAKLLISDKLWGHLDYLYGKDALKFVYKDVVRFLNKG